MGMAMSGLLPGQCMSYAGIGIGGVIGVDSCMLYADSVNVWPFFAVTCGTCVNHMYKGCD